MKTEQKTFQQMLDEYLSDYDRNTAEMRKHLADTIITNEAYKPYADAVASTVATLQRIWKLKSLL